MFDRVLNTSLTFLPLNSDCSCHCNWSLKCLGLDINYGRIVRLAHKTNKTNFVWKVYHYLKVQGLLDSFINCVPFAQLNGNKKKCWKVNVSEFNLSEFCYAETLWKGWKKCSTNSTLKRNVPLSVSAKICNKIHKISYIKSKLLNIFFKRTRIINCLDLIFRL